MILSTPDAVIYIFSILIEMFKPSNFDHLSSVKVEVVLFDQRGEPLSAADSSKMLTESGAREELQQSVGFPVAIVDPSPPSNGPLPSGVGE